MSYRSLLPYEPPAWAKGFKLQPTNRVVVSLVSRASLTSKAIKESGSGRLRHTSVPPARILAEPMKTEY